MSLRVAGAVIFMIAAYYTWHSQSYTVTFGDVLGPAIFPLIVGIPTLILAASLVVFPTGSVDWPSQGRMLRQLLAVGVLIGYAWLLRPLGFPLATFALIVALALTLGGTPWKAVALGAVFGPGLWVLFDKVLGLPLALLGSLFI